MANSITNFRLLQTTIADIHEAYRLGDLIALQLVQMYLERIEMYDSGPTINAVITINPKALDEADRLDAAFPRVRLPWAAPWDSASVKDQADLKGMPTTLGRFYLRTTIPTKTPSSQRN